MSTSSPSADAAAIQAHLNIFQSVIQRMAANSAGCKGWCITLVSAILVILAGKGQPEHFVIAGIPVLLFLALDTYYLSLERGFREAYNGFIRKLHADTLATSDMYAIQPIGTGAKQFFGALLSPSVWPFYLTLAVMVVLTRRFL